MYIVYRRSEADLPARAEEMEHTKEEGIIFKTLTNPTAILGYNNPEDKRGGIIVGEDGLTSRESVYAGGDAVTGAATVILAMGAGKTAAAAIDAQLGKK